MRAKLLANKMGLSAYIALFIIGIILRVGQLSNAHNKTTYDFAHIESLWQKTEDVTINDKNNQKYICINKAGITWVSTSKFCSWEEIKGLGVETDIHNKSYVFLEIFTHSGPKKTEYIDCTTLTISADELCKLIS